MTARHVALPLSAAVWGLVAIACVAPNETGEEFRIELAQTPSLVFTGDTFRIAATVVDADGHAVPHVAVRFTHCRLHVREGAGGQKDWGTGPTLLPCEPTDPPVVDVNAETGFTRGLRAGRAAVAAYASEWPNTEFVADTVEVRAGVSAGVESYWPDESLFGDTVTIVGAVLDPDSLSAILVGSAIFSVPEVLRRFRPGQAGAHDTLVVWVLPPAVRDGSIQIVRVNGLNPVLPLTIQQQDVLEPNSLASPRVLPGSFWNPGLALEASNPVDWYRTGVPSASALTITVDADGAEPRLIVERVGSQSSVVVGSSEFRCRDRTWYVGAPMPGHTEVRVSVDLEAGDSLQFSVHGPETGRLVPYALTIEPAYVSALPPDPAESNDFCEDAYTLPAADTALTLNFDNVPDFDWFRVPVDGLRHITVSTTNDQDVDPLVFLFAEETADSVPLAAAAGGQPLERIVGPGSYLLLVANPGGSAAVGGLPYELHIASSLIDIAAIEIAEDSIVIAEGEDGRLGVTVYDSEGGTLSGLPLEVTSTAANVEAEYGDDDLLHVGGTWSASAGTAWIRVGVSNTPEIADSVLVRLTLASPLLAVWGFPDGEVFVSQGIEGINALLRFTGGVGSEVGAFYCSDGCGNPVFGLWGTDPTELWGVGHLWTALGELSYPRYFLWDGTSWGWGVANIEFANLYAIWGSSATDFWAVGGLGLTSPEPQFRHSDGANWVVIATPALATGELRGIWGSGPDDVWAVGGTGNVPKVVHYDGTSWSDASPATGNGELRGIWGSGASDVWAVGQAGLVLHWDGTTWKTVEPGAARDLHGVFGTGPADVWAVGSGVILHYDGAAWSQVQTGFDGFSLNAVWAGSPDDVWTVGQNGLILHFDGVSWRRLGWEQ